METELMPRERALLASCALVFSVSTAGTIYFCKSMSGGMAMPGGWTMSMAWMKMPGQSRFAAIVAFIAMWVVMMVAMMLPSLTPTLVSYRRSLHESGKSSLGWLAAVAGAGYFFFWAILGAFAYALGLVLTTAEMHWLPLARNVPVATGAVLLLAGFFQLTAWKTRQLSRCRDAPACSLPLSPSVPNAWRQGLSWGVDCGLCCCGFMAILLVSGVMNLAAMAVLAAAITVERLVPRPERTARVAGVVMLAAGVFVIVRALHTFGP